MRRFPYLGSQNDQIFRSESFFHTCACSFQILLQVDCRAVYALRGRANPSVTDFTFAAIAVCALQIFSETVIAPDVGFVGLLVSKVHPFQSNLKLTEIYKDPPVRHQLVTRGVAPELVAYKVQLSIYFF